MISRVLSRLVWRIEGRGCLFLEVFWVRIKCISILSLRICMLIMVRVFFLSRVFFILVRYIIFFVISIYCYGKVWIKFS